MIKPLLMVCCLGLLSCQTTQSKQTPSSNLVSLPTSNSETSLQQAGVLRISQGNQAQLTLNLNDSPIFIRVKSPKVGNQVTLAGTSSAPSSVPNQATKIRQLHQQAIEAFEQQDYWQSLQLSNQALVMDNNLVDSWELKGDAYWQLSLPLQAKEAWRQALLLAPERVGLQLKLNQPE